MKNKKWIWITLTIFLTLIVLVGVAGAGYRVGVMQSAVLMRNTDRSTSQFQPFGQMRSFDEKFNDQNGGNPRMMQEFNRGGFIERGRGGFFYPLFGLIKLAVLGALLWLGYRFVKNSGWRLTRVE